MRSSQKVQKIYLIWSKSKSAKSVKKMKNRKDSHFGKELNHGKLTFYTLSSQLRKGYPSLALFPRAAADRHFSNDGPVHTHVQKQQ